MMRENRLMYDLKTNYIIYKNKKMLINTLVLKNNFILVGDPPIDSQARLNLDIPLTCYLMAIRNKIVELKEKPHYIIFGLQF